LSSWTKT